MRLRRGALPLCRMPATRARRRRARPSRRCGRCGPGPRGGRRGPRSRPREAARDRRVQGLAAQPLGRGAQECAGERATSRPAPPWRSRRRAGGHRVGPPDRVQRHEHPAQNIVARRREAGTEPQQIDRRGAPASRIGRVEPSPQPLARAAARPAREPSPARPLGPARSAQGRRREPARQRDAAIVAARTTAATRLRPRHRPRGGTPELGRRRVERDCADAKRCADR